MPLVHSFAPETTQCRGSDAAINANFPLFESLDGGDEREAEDVIFPPADVAFAASEKHADVAVAVAVAGSREAMVDDGAGDDGHRSGPMPDIVSIAAAAAPSNASSSEGFPVQAHSATTANAAGVLEEEQLRHENVHHHYGTENEYHAYANHHPSAQGLPSGGVGTAGDQRGKESHLPNLAREKGDLEINGEKLILHAMSLFPIGSVLRTCSSDISLNIFQWLIVMLYTLSTGLVNRVFPSLQFISRPIPFPYSFCKIILGHFLEFLEAEQQEGNGPIDQRAKRATN